MRAAAGTDRGRVRLTNEDSVLADAASGILIVADGMGGHRAGEVASAMAVSAIHESLKQAPAAPGPTGLDVPGLVQTAIEEANQAIWSRAAADWDLRGMGTTVVVVFSPEESLWVAHVGDSRAYLARPNELTRLTQDHSLVAQMVKAGEITPEEARSHPLRNVISRCLGTERTVQAEIQELAWAPGDTLVLCSDGLTGMLADEEIERVLRDTGEDLEAACRRLISLANDRGGRDNISVVVARKG